MIISPQCKCIMKTFLNVKSSGTVSVKISRVHDKTRMVSEKDFHTIIKTGGGWG